MPSLGVLPEAADVKRRADIATVAIEPSGVRRSRVRRSLERAERTQAELSSESEPVCAARERSAFLTS